MYPAKAWRTGAGVTVYTVGAICAVFARVALAFVDVFLASVAAETRQAGAGERINGIFAKSSVTAGIGFAVIDVRLAIAARVARLAAAFVAANGVLTGGAISARVFDAFVDVDLACLALPSFRTHAGEALIVFGLSANTSIFTGFWAAWGQQGLTVFTSVR